MGTNKIGWKSDPFLTWMWEIIYRYQLRGEPKLSYHVIHLCGQSQPVLHCVAATVSHSWLFKKTRSGSDLSLPVTQRWSVVVPTLRAEGRSEVDAHTCAHAWNMAWAQAWFEHLHWWHGDAAPLRENVMKSCFWLKVELSFCVVEGDWVVATARNPQGPVKRTESLPAQLTGTSGVQQAWENRLSHQRLLLAFPVMIPHLTQAREGNEY